jgi:predicted dehydrogenase
MIQGIIEETRDNMNTTGKVKYNYEYKRKIRAGFIGCGGHSYRNILPAFQYAPIELAAVCDLDVKKAATFARMFGAESFYSDYHKMIKHEDIDAVFVVTDYDEKHEPKYPKIAIDIMKAGCHAWIEKPPAASVSQILEMMKVEKKTGKFTMVGFKKMFFPAIQELKRIMSKKEFGKAGSIYLKYPQSLPPDGRRDDAKAMQWFLDHIVHPASTMQFLMGPVETVYFQRSMTGDAAVTIKFVSGAAGVLHLSAGRSGTAPLERVEVIGEGANAIVENGVKLTYYKPGNRGEGGYSHGSSYIGKMNDAPICWEPEFSLGETSNKAIFMLGYVGEILEFCDCVLKNKKPYISGLSDALEIMKFYEAFKNPSGKTIDINKRKR